MPAGRAASRKFIFGEARIEKTLRERVLDRGPLSLGRPYSPSFEGAAGEVPMTSRSLGGPKPSKWKILKGESGNRRGEKPAMIIFE